tara:strand:- start:4228 stop:4587 length:360 start_codon:yes stop_codon:yes gene_type:complete
MAKKKKHTYKVGQTVKFKFFDGSVHKGQIAELTYMGDVVGDKIYYDCPQYTIHVPSDRYPRGYMVYSSMTDERIKEATDVDPRMPNWFKKDVLPKVKAKKSMSELDMAILKQKEFINNH